MKLLTKTLTALTALTILFTAGSPIAQAQVKNVTKAGIPISIDDNNDGRMDSKCTLGAVVQLNNIPYGVTARHCVESVNSTVYGLTNGTYYRIGKPTAIYKNFDIALINLNYGNRQSVYLTNVASVNKISQSAHIGKLGATTHTTYGKINPQSITDCTVRYGNQVPTGDKIYCWSTQLYTDHGDSGGPVYFTEGNNRGKVFSIVTGGADNGDSTVTPISVVFDIVPQ